MMPRRRLEPEKPGMGESFWNNVKRRSEDMMRAFDHSPDWMQDHIREKNTTIGAKKPPPTIGQIATLLRPGVAMFAYPRGLGLDDWDLGVDHKRDVFILTIKGRPFDFFTIKEIRDDSYKVDFGPRMNKILDQYQRESNS